jgi:hypothetical protein
VGGEGGRDCQGCRLTAQTTVDVTRVSLLVNRKKTNYEPRGTKHDVKEEEDGKEDFNR